MSTRLLREIKTLMGDILMFIKNASKLEPRNYQEDVAIAIVDSIIKKKGIR